MTENKINKDTTKNAARFAGILFIVQMAAAVISHSVILTPIFRSEQFLSIMASSETKVIVAMLLDLITGASVFGIAVILFPILKKYSERIAVWYSGLRLSEWVIALISGMFLMTVLSISKDFVQAGSNETAYLQTLSEYFLKSRGSIRILMLLCFCLSASMFYFLLFKYRLLPRFISVWGLIGVILLFAEVLSNLFGSTLGGIIIMLPMGLNEIFLGVWLIVKGFNVNSGDQYVGNE
jgi:Domain of unknown function (DUF4386)